MKKTVFFLSLFFLLPQVYGATTEVVEFDPRDKYYKPAGFGNPPAPHYEYIEFGRNPWQYRPGGSAIARTDQWMPYPRTCAHRGFIGSGPENSLPALAAEYAAKAASVIIPLPQ